MIHYSSDGRVILRPPTGDDADVLYNDLVGTSITETILWDGPESPESYRDGLKKRGEQNDWERKAP